MPQNFRLTSNKYECCLRHPPTHYSSAKKDVRVRQPAREALRLVRRSRIRRALGRVQIVCGDEGAGDEAGEIAELQRNRARHR
jgi:hypothetical protein